MANGMGSLYVGMTGLKANQLAINATSNNLTNVDTEGYVREQVLFGDRNYSKLADPIISTVSNQTANMKQSGNGVGIGDIIHSRDQFLDQYYRTETGRKAFYTAAYDTTNEVEELLQEMNGEAFQDVISDFSVAFQELSKDPGAAVNQNLVIQKATLFIERAQSLYSGLAEYQTNMDGQIESAVNQINSYGNQIYNLNEQIRTVEAGHVETAMELRDKRDLALDKLSELANISYSEDYAGVVSVKLEGVNFIDDVSCHEMAATRDDSSGFIIPTWKDLSDYSKDKEVSVFHFDADISTELNTDIGKLKSLVLSRGTKSADFTDIIGLDKDTYNDTTGMSTMEMIEAQLDQLVHGVVTKVNQVFSPITAANITVGGVNQSVNVWDEDAGSLGADMEPPGAELFSRKFMDRYREVTDDSGKTWYVYNEENSSDSNSLYTTVSTDVNPDLINDETKLPHLSKNGEVNYTIGTALTDTWDLQDLSLSPMSTEPCNIKEYYQRMVGNLGTYGNIYSSVKDTLESSTLAISSQRSEVMGVSSDEELANMIMYQNAYNAASRYINVVDAMMEQIVTQLGA